MSIEDVIGEYVQLKRAGRYYRGLSPFTNEKTPSFFVTPDRDIWHDFSSNKGGDIFSFVMEVEGLDFHGALDLLARKAGVDLSQYDSRAPKDLSARKNRILEMNNHALNYFQREMLKSKEAQDYISGQRKINKETVMKWGIGYAPADSKLKNLLLRQKFTEAEIREAGLIGGRGGEMFRSRMMIPLRDGQGQVVGFTGRIIGDGEPKYLNTPATILYDKGRQVFGLNFAKQAIRANDFSVLVEGNLDVISSHQVGVENVVACAGTALTSNHLKSLSRLSRNVRLCFDGDKAGIAATERAIGLAEPIELKLSVVTIKGAKDPDELIQSDVEEWRMALDDHSPAVEWVIKRYAEMEDLKSADGIKTLTSKSLGLVKNLRDAVEQEFYLKQISSLTGSSVETLKRKMAGVEVVNQMAARRVLKPTNIVRREYNRRDETYLLNNIFAIALGQSRLRSVLNNLPDAYLTESFAKTKYHLLGKKIEIDSTLADKLAELEIVADQEIGVNVDERVLLLGYLRELELLRLRSLFEQLSRELASALDKDETGRITILNGAVNSVKRDLSAIEKTSARDDFAGLFEVWQSRKSES